MDVGRQAHPRLPRARARGVAADHLQRPQRPHRVNARTLERVLPAIRESGYRPHIAGRQLRTRRSRTLAMRLFPSADGINGAILDRFLHALTEAAQRDCYRLTLFTALDDDGEIAAIDELLSVADIDGIVLTSTHRDDPRTAWLLEHDVPFVAFGRPWFSDRDPLAARHAWVDVDGASGTSDATDSLLARGHRRIGFLGWPAGSDVGDDRRAGWQRALRAAGADETTCGLFLGVEDSVAEGARGAHTLFDRGATALVCVSDSLAIGAAAEWHQRTAQAGPDVPVVGFDDTPVAAALGLSSVRQPIEQVAERLLALLLQRLADHAGPKADSGARGAPEHLLLPASLVLREPDPHLMGVRAPVSGHRGPMTPASTTLRPSTNPRSTSPRSSSHEGVK